MKKPSKYKPNGACPKCKAKFPDHPILTHWCSGGEASNRGWHEYGGTRYHCPKGEHFHRHCSRCHYEWLESTA